MIGSLPLVRRTLCSKSRERSTMETIKHHSKQEYPGIFIFKGPIPATTPHRIVQPIKCQAQQDKLGVHVPVHVRAISLSCVILTCISYVHLHRYPSIHPSIHPSPFVSSLKIHHVQRIPMKYSKLHS